MNDRESTARSRELGAGVRRARESAGYGQVQLAMELGWSASRLCRVETGKRGGSERDIMTLLLFCRVVGEDLDRLLSLCSDLHDRSWLQVHRERLPDEGRTLVVHERTAAWISEYDPLAIPSLLQTEDYARAVLRLAGPVPEHEINRRVRARLSRQIIFRQQSPPALEFFISELALRSPIVGNRVMNDQLLHLVLASSRSHCGIRLLPAAIGPCAVVCGPFRLMDYAEHGSVAYVEHHTTSLFLEEPEDIATYRAILDRLKQAALDQDQSRDLLVRMANEYDRPEDDHDGTG